MPLPDSRDPHSPVLRFVAHWLFLLAAWTLVIKFIFPMAYALAEDKPVHIYIYWDFWWVAHVWLGWVLINRPPYTYWLAMTVSVAEIIIIVTKFVFFLSAPVWTMWSTNWFINKLFVLACFVVLLSLLLARRTAFSASWERKSSRLHDPG